MCKKVFSTRRTRFVRNKSSLLIHYAIKLSVTVSDGEEILNSSKLQILKNLSVSDY